MNTPSNHIPGVIGAASATNAASTAIDAMEHLSWSRVRQYLQCPRAFEFRYVIQAEPAFTPVTLAVGVAVHRVVERALERQLEGLPPLSDGEIPPLIEESLNALQPAASVDAPDRCTAVRCASALVTTLPTILDGEILAIEESVEGRPWEDLPAITGRVDLIVRSGDAVRIVDFKTSRARWDARDVRLQAGQLALYQLLAADRYTDTPGSTPQLQFITVTKAKQPVVTTHDAPLIDPANLHQQFADVWRGIRAGVFPARPDHQCLTCPYQRRCSHAAV